jgi:hypothetical protein
MARHILRLILLIALMSACAQVSSAKKPNPNTFVGTFTVNIRGYWNGQGAATVTATTVQIQATLTDEGGNVGTLSTAALTVTDGHFTGTGTVFGIPMTISGRVEAKDPPPMKGKGKGKTKTTDNGDQVLTDARLGATFVANSHTGRIAGGRD